MHTEKKHDTKQLAGDSSWPSRQSLFLAERGFNADNCPDYVTPVFGGDSTKCPLYVRLLIDTIISRHYPPLMEVTHQCWPYSPPLLL